MKQNFTKNMLERFSCFLVGGEKKGTGHKILLESLDTLRENNDFVKSRFSSSKDVFQENTSLLKRDLPELKNIQPRSKTLTKSKRFGSANFQFAKSSENFNKSFSYQQENIIRQFISLPFLVFDRNNAKNIADLYLLNPLKKSQHFLKDNKKKSVDTSFRKFESTENFTKISKERKKVVAEKNRKQNNVVFKNTEFVLKRDFLEKVSKEKISNKGICMDLVENVKPILETRKVRKGRVTYRVPKVTSPQRQEGKAISLLIENANLRKKNDSRRLISSLGDLDLFLNTKSPLVASFPDNLSHLSFLFVSQTIIKQSSFKQLNGSDFLILPSKKSCSAKNEPSFKKIKTHSKLHFLEKDITFNIVSQKKEVVEKELFLTTPEKKHLYTNFRKQNIEFSLSEEFFDIVSKKGESIEKRKQLHNFALQNRAYGHFRWW